jgi:hypothetical protein
LTTVVGWVVTWVIVLTSEIVVAKIDGVEEVVNMVVTNVVEIICVETNVVAEIVELVVLCERGTTRLICPFLTEKTEARTTMRITRSIMRHIKYLFLISCRGL